MTDSLDPIRRIARGEGSIGNAEIQLLAIAQLKLADENWELRKRITVLELDRDAHTKRIDNAFYCAERLEELIVDKAKRFEHWADIIEAHGGAIDAHTERLHIHDTDLQAAEASFDGLQRGYEQCNTRIRVIEDRITRLEQDCLIVSNQHVDRMGALETWVGNVAEVVSRVEIRVSDIEIDLRALTERIAAYIQTNTEIAHTVLGLITTLADRITELETTDD